MPQLDNYLVTLGMKGQNIVLSTMDKIRKKGGDLSKKKATVLLAAKVTPKKARPEAPGEEKPESRTVPGEKPKPRTVPGEKPKPRTVPGEKPGEKPTLPDEKNNKKFSRAVDNFHSGVKDFSSSAATLDPMAAVTSMTSAIGTSLSGISVLGVSLGRLPEGIAHIANSTLTMAKNSIDMAKQGTAAFHSLTMRNAAAAYYGEKVTEKSPLSRNERAMFIDAVSNSMGRIGRPLAEEINKLIGTKDTRALARVSAGDWESTGTDKGWMLGQISSSFQGLPPSIKQKLQASLLKNYSGEIQNMAPGQAAVQQNAATFANMEEDQTKRIYDKSTENMGGVIDAIQKMNNLQLELYGTGLKFTQSISDATKALAELPDTISKMHSTMKKFVDDPSIRNARELMKSVKVGK